MNFLSNPRSESAEAKYGLVVGYVQSGKTANYSGLIARAADSGYKFIIVLTGGTSDLRNQTQKRLSKEITGTLFDEEGNHVDQSKYSKKWNEVTKVTSYDGYPPGARILDEGDLSGTLSDKNDSFFEEDRPILIVMKKTGPSLVELNTWINGIPETLESGKRYFVIADGGRGGGDAGDGGLPSDACGPEFIHEEGIKAYYSIYLPNGGHTTQELRVNTYAVGESVT